MVIKSRFLFDVLLPEEEICNLEEEKKRLIDFVQDGRRSVVYGLRNTGKTSLLRSVVIPRFLKTHKKGMVVFVDLMGVRSLDGINNRIKISFEDAITTAQPSRAYIQNLMRAFRALRPTMTADPLTGQMSFSLGIDKPAQTISFTKILREIGSYHTSGANQRALIIFDEFQDIVFVNEADAKFRAALQELPADLPIVISGSKKHLLANLFAPTQAPLAAWGTDIHIPIVLSSPSYAEKYHQYIENRFSSKRLSIESESSRHLFELLLGIPEPINIVCQYILDHAKSGTEITSREIEEAIVGTMIERKSRYEERLSKNSENENLILAAIAKNQPVKSPKGKFFLRQIPTLSPSTIFTIVNRLEDEAEVYNLDGSVVLADPLLAFYLRRFR